MKYYTGVGSRETPEAIQVLMTRVAHHLHLDGYTLRSGAADGADLAFETGATLHKSSPQKEIYIPWDKFNGARIGDAGVFSLKMFSEELLEQAEEAVEALHPAFSKLTSGAKALHTRNIFQVLGLDLNTPSTFLICYAKPVGNSVKGGTRTAVELAKLWNIPVYNMYDEIVQERFRKYVHDKEKVASHLMQGIKV